MSPPRRRWMLVGAVVVLGIGAIGWSLRRSAGGISLGRRADLNITTAAIDATVPDALAAGQVPGAEVAIAIDDSGVAGHIGVNRGFCARLLVTPAERVVLAVVTNGDNGRDIVDAVLAAWHSTD